MSRSDGRKQRNKRRRATGRRRGTLAQSRKPKWVVGGSIAAGLIAVTLIGSAGEAHALHPTPRAGTHAGHVVNSEKYAQYPRVAMTYRMAASVPQILDGLYCYCECSEHSGHYSLLDCFKSDHAARCDVCLSEAAIGYNMSQNGASLDDIRAEADRTFGT